MMRKRSDLRGYQNRAVDWLFERDAGFGILDLGAGKTAIALTAAVDLIAENYIRHGLVIAPKRVAELVWPTEVTEWQHTAGMRMALCVGSPAERLKIMGCASTRQLTVIGIDNVQWLVDKVLKARPANDPLFDLLIIDETSKLKNPLSKRARALGKVVNNFRNIWGLTGTPRPNGEQDLFKPAAIVTRGKLWGRSFPQWRDERFNFIANTGKWEVKAAWRQRIWDEFAGYAFTVDEADMPDLPDLNTIIHPVRLPADVMTQYRLVEAGMRLEMAAAHTPAERAGAMVATGKLAQMVSGFLYPEVAGDPITYLHESKLEFLDEMVETLDGEPLLVVYEFVEDVARLRRRYGVNLPVIGGGTSGHDAARYIEDWNLRRLPILAIHPASAGHGLNLQKGGSHMVWLGLTWSPELYQQTIKRIHRPGQTRHVSIHVPFVSDSVDGLKRDRVIEKMTAQEAFTRFLRRI